MKTSRYFLLPKNNNSTGKGVLKLKQKSFFMVKYHSEIFGLFWIFLKTQFGALKFG